MFIRNRPFVFCTFLLCGNTPTFAGPVITRISESEGVVTLLFEDPEGISNQFSLQRATGLTAGAWQNFNTATFTSLGANLHRVTVPKRALDQEFYRIIGSFLGTGVDPDGDGLPTILEHSFTANTGSVNYSSSTLFDTDGDGFSDGVEYSAGTQPNNSASRPTLLSLPQVAFAAATSSLMEGDGTLQIPLTISSAFSGSISYDISLVGSSAAAQTGTVTAPQASIPFTVIDDFVVEPRILIAHFNCQTICRFSRCQGKSGSLRFLS